MSKNKYSELSDQDNEINKTADTKSKMENTATEGEDKTKAKKNKKLLYGIVGGVLVIAVVLAIALPLALRSDNSKPPGPPVDPKIGDNPYAVDANSLVIEDYKVQGVIRSPKDYNNFASLAEVLQVE